MRAGFRRGITPLHLQIMLHYYCSPIPYSADNPTHAYSQAVTEYTAELIKNDLLAEGNEHLNSTSGYHTTQAGRIWIDMILASALRDAFIVRTLL